MIPKSSFKLAVASRVHYKKPNFCVFLLSFFRRLSANLDFAFAALSAEAGAASAAPNHISISKMVSPERFERSTNSLKGYCSAVELRAQIIEFIQLYQCGMCLTRVREALYTKIKQVKGGERNVYRYRSDSYHITQ